MSLSYEVITLALLSMRGIGTRTVRGLWNLNLDLTSIEQIGDAFRKVEGSRKPLALNVEAIEKAIRNSIEIVEQCQRDDITILNPVDSSFPPQLISIPNAPLLLFVRGEVSCLNADSIAIIGTRGPTEFGDKCARRMAHTLAENGWVIVSGLAEGCDTAGHEGCLDASGRTVAFLAHGFGRIYPSSNKALAERIVKSGGCLVTEYVPGKAPTRGAFVERDRLQSGLSLGIVVIETDVKGGTMHTVRHAEEQGRPIATLLHPEDKRDVPQAQGNQLLIQQKKAVALKDKADLLKFSSQARKQCAEKLETILGDPDRK